MPALHSLRAAFKGALGLTLLLPLAAAGQGTVATAGDAYEAALSLARHAATPVQIDAAIHSLTELLSSYPQDVDLPLELGGLLYRRARFAESLHAYELARVRSAGGGDADLGLGWVLFKLGRCQEAVAAFRAVLSTKPSESSAQEGLALCTNASSQNRPPRLWLGPFLSQSFYIYRDHPLINYGVAPTARLDALLVGRYYGAVVYRYSYFSPPNGSIASWSQHDIYLDLGITTKSFGGTLHYARIADGSAYAGTSHHIGITGRYSFIWDIFLNFSASFYSDEPVLRGELAVRIPAFVGLSVRPAFAMQWIPGSLFKTGTLTLFYDHRRVSVWLGGKFGDELRAAYLNVGYVYIGPQRIPYGVWAGVAVRPGARFTLSLGYTHDRLVRSDVTPVEDSTVHSLTLGLLRDF